MNTNRAIEAFREMGFGDTAFIKGKEVAEKLHAFGELEEYLSTCVTADGFYFAGVRIAGKDSLIDENGVGASPGGKLRKYGYTVIATDLGGNAIVCSNNGKIYWADHTSYDNPEEISYDDHDTGERIYVPWTESNVMESMRLVAESLDEFIDAVRSGKIEEVLEEFDR